jgi:hypothetical protein
MGVDKFAKPAVKRGTLWYLSERATGYPSPFPEGCRLLTAPSNVATAADATGAAANTRARGREGKDRRSGPPLDDNEDEKLGRGKRKRRATAIAGAESEWDSPAASRTPAGPDGETPQGLAIRRIKVHISPKDRRSVSVGTSAGDTTEDHDDLDSASEFDRSGSVVPPTHKKARAKSDGFLPAAPRLMSLNVNGRHHSLASLDASLATFSSSLTETHPSASSIFSPPPSSLFGRPSRSHSLFSMLPSADRAGTLASEYAEGRLEHRAGSAESSDSEGADDTSKDDFHEAMLRADFDFEFDFTFGKEGSGLRGASPLGPHDHSPDTPATTPRSPRGCQTGYNSGVEDDGFELEPAEEAVDEDTTDKRKTEPRPTDDASAEIVPTGGPRLLDATLCPPKARYYPPRASSPSGAYLYYLPSTISHN